MSGMRERVLVVGGAGYIGSHVVLALREKHHEAVVLDDLSSGSEENLRKDVPFYRGDLCDTSMLKHIFTRENITAVIHLAALKAAGDSMIDPSTYAIHNISGTLTLLGECLNANIPKFIFSSSAAVYGDPEYIPLNESHPLNPANFYGFTKLEVERILNWYHDLKGLKIACLRYFNAAGYDADGRVPGLERNPKNLIPLVMEVASGQRSHLDIYGTDYPTPDGSCIRDYIHVSDLATAHVMALDYLTKETKLTCNLGTGVGTSVLEVIRRLEDLLQSELPVKRVGRRPGDPPELYAASDRARELLGWEPVHSGMDQILKTTWDAYQNQKTRSSAPA